MNEPKRVRATLEKHQKNLEWNFTRIYRIRNEIVHNAAMKDSITTILSHLRYYLTFAIVAIIDFLANHPIDANSDGAITIDDFFVLQDLKLSSLEAEKNSNLLQKLIQMENPIRNLI